MGFCRVRVGLAKFGFGSTRGLLVGMERVGFLSGSGRVGLVKFGFGSTHGFLCYKFWAAQPDFLVRNLLKVPKNRKKMLFLPAAKAGGQRLVRVVVLVVVVVVVVVGDITNF